MSLAGKSLHDNLIALVTVLLGAHTASVTGTAVDAGDSFAEQFLVMLGTWTDGTHTVTFSHRDLPTDAWVAITATDLDSVVPGVLDGSGHVVISDNSRAGKCFQVGYTGGKRYLKADGAGTGTTTGAVYGVVAQQGRLRNVGNTPMNPSDRGALWG